MKAFLLSHYCISAWLVKWECRHCKRRADRVRVHAPEIERDGNTIKLAYPVNCPCGGRSSFRVELPILLLGVILVRILLIEKWSHRRGNIDITPGGQLAESYHRFVQDFELAVVEFAEQALGFPRDESKSKNVDGDRWAGLGDPERVKFGMSVQEWQAFLHRLGVDEPPTQEGQNGQTDDDG